MNESRLAQLLTPVLERCGLELDAIEIVPAGKRRLVRVVVDGDGAAGSGLLLDDIAEATKAVSISLDESDVMGAAPYTLEVSSRGVSRPLTLPRHWRRNRGRLVAVTLAGGTKVRGRIVETTEGGVVLATDGQQQSIDYADVSKALVQVELNREVEEED